MLIKGFCSLDNLEEEKRKMYDAVFKICIFGDGGVGKTTLVNKYLTGVFKADTTITIGVDFHIKTLEMNGLKVRLQIWDFAGEERFRFLLPGYVRGSAGGIFMYDITRFASLKNINGWLQVLNTDIQKTPQLIPILLVGGKTDLEEYRTVSTKDALDIAKSFNLNGFIECSAKNGENIDVIFETIANVMLERAGLIQPNEDYNKIKISY